MAIGSGYSPDAAADPLGACWDGLGREGESLGEGGFSREEHAWPSIEPSRPVGKDELYADLSWLPLPRWRLPEPAPSGCPIAVIHRLGDIGTGCEGGGKMGWG